LVLVLNQLLEGKSERGETGETSETGEEFDLLNNNNNNNKKHHSQPVSQILPFSI
jgi:hypothetical protein